MRASLDGLTELAAPPAETGLSAAEAERRLRARGPVEPPATSRSTASIVRANVFTVFNLILATFGTVTLLYGDWRDALFLGILVANTAVGITQEVRAKPVPHEKLRQKPSPLLAYGLRGE